MNFEHIIVTTDFSDDSVGAFEIAAYQGKMSNCKVTLLNVVADWDVPETLLRQIPNPESVSAYRQELLEKSKEHLAELAKKHFHGQNVVEEVILSSKPVSEEISEYAERNKANMIVMSSHGRGAVGDFFLGSVVQKTIRISPCPVLVVPKKK